MSVPRRTPTDQQKDVITHVGGPSLAVAVAGAGKTEVLVSRVEYLLSCGVRPEAILTTTFSRLGAADIRRRAAAYGVPPFECRTLHAVARQVLFQSVTGKDESGQAQFMRGISARSEIPSKAQLLGIVRKSIKSVREAGAVGVSSLDTFAVTDERVLSEIQFAKTQLVFPAAWTAADGRVFPAYFAWAMSAGRPRHFARVVLRCYSDLEASRVDPAAVGATGAKRGVRWDDHEDVVAHVARAILERQPWAMAWAGRYEHVTIDECLPGRALVPLADGSLLRIEDIVERKIDVQVMSWNVAAGRAEPRRVVGWHKTLRRGRRILRCGPLEATEDHPVYVVGRGYVPLGSVGCRDSLLRLDHEALRSSQLDAGRPSQFDAGRQVDSVGVSAWRCGHPESSREERQREVEVRPFGHPSSLLGLEISASERLRHDASEGPDDDRVRRNRLFVLDGESPSLFRDLCFCAREAARHGQVVEPVGRSGARSLVHGRWLCRAGFHWLGDVLVRETSSTARSRVVAFEGDRRACSFGVRLGRIGRRRVQGGYDCNASGGSRTIRGACATVRSSNVQVQAGSSGGRREGTSSNGSSADPAELCFCGVEVGMRCLREEVHAAQVSDPVRRVGVSSTEGRIQGSEGQGSQEAAHAQDEWVYCLDVEENHNFFAGDSGSSILVHNCQDTALGQWTLAEHLARDKNVMAIGDDGQRVFSFRIGRQPLMSDFMKRHGLRMRLFPLTKNYRSAPAILAAANGVLSAMKSRLIPDLLVCGRTDGTPGVVLGHAHKDATEESEWAVGEVKAALASGTKPEEIAVIYRTNAYAGPVETVLVREQVPYRVSGKSFYASDLVQSAAAWVALALDENDVTAWRVCWRNPLRWLKREFLDEYPTFAKFKADSKVAVSRFPKARGLLGDVERVRKALAQGTSRAVWVAYHEVGLKLHAAERGEDGLSPDFVDEVVRSVVASAQAFSDPAQFVAHVRSMGDETSDQSGEKIGSGVTLTTSHAAKGLEYKLVIVIGMQEGRFPLRGEDEEEEARLAYVTFTRARDTLLLSWQREGFKDPEAVKPSRYLFQARVRMAGAKPVAAPVPPPKPAKAAARSRK